MSKRRDPPEDAPEGREEGPLRQRTATGAVGTRPEIPIEPMPAVRPIGAGAGASAGEAATVGAAAATPSASPQLALELAATQRAQRQLQQQVQQLQQAQQAEQAETDQQLAEMKRAQDQLMALTAGAEPLSAAQQGAAPSSTADVTPRGGDVDPVPPIAQRTGIDPRLAAAWERAQQAQRRTRAQQPAGETPGTLPLSALSDQARQLILASRSAPAGARARTTGQEGAGDAAAKVPGTARSPTAAARTSGAGAAGAGAAGAGAGSRALVAAGRPSGARTGETKGEGKRDYIDFEREQWPQTGPPVPRRIPDEESILAEGVLQPLRIISELELQTNRQRVRLQENERAFREADEKRVELENRLREVEGVRVQEQKEQQSTDTKLQQLEQQLQVLQVENAALQEQVKQVRIRWPGLFAQMTPNAEEFSKRVLLALRGLFPLSPAPPSDSVELNKTLVQRLFDEETAPFSHKTSLDLRTQEMASQLRAVPEGAVTDEPQPRRKSLVVQLLNQSRRDVGLAELEVEAKGEEKGESKGDVKSMVLTAVAQLLDKYQPIVNRVRYFVSGARLADLYRTLVAADQASPQKPARVDLRTARVVDLFQNFPQMVQQRRG